MPTHSDNDKAPMNYFCPHAFTYVVCVLAVIVGYWSLIFDYIKNPSDNTIFYFAAIIGVVFYYSVIKIANQQLILPLTNHNGYPEWFTFQKKIIDIGLIKKIIIYRPNCDAKFIFFSEDPIKTPDAKISIIGSDSVNAQISYNFYGVEQVEGLTASILSRNESIEVMESGRN